MKRASRPWTRVNTDLLHAVAMFFRCSEHVLQCRLCQSTRNDIPARYLIMACSINLQASFVLYHDILKRINVHWLISRPLVSYIDNIRVVSALAKLTLAIFYKSSRRNLSQVSNPSQNFLPWSSFLLSFFSLPHCFCNQRSQQEGYVEADSKTESKRVSEKFVMVFLFVPYRLLFRRNLPALQRRIVRSMFTWSEVFLQIKLTLYNQSLKRPNFNCFSLMIFSGAEVKI